MDCVYAFGISSIEFIQYWLSDYASYFELVNNLSSPNYTLDVIYPFVAAIDSVFASQMLLCTAFGAWMNSVMKWWFLDDRPYWWVNTTSYYPPRQRPQIQQTAQTCETGPGFPSGHTTSMAMVIMLFLMWTAHIMTDRKCYVWWWKLVMYPAAALALVSVMLARMYVGAHFPHQCLVGALIGFFLAPALCIYVTDPYIWGTASLLPNAKFWQIMTALSSLGVAATTYWSLKLLDVDPYFTVDLAYRYCQRPCNIHVTTTPLYALAHSTGGLFGFVLAISPELKHYRHYTKDRSLIIAFVASYIFTQFANHIRKGLDRSNDSLFYGIIFLMSIVKPLFYLRGLPALARIPFKKPNWCEGIKVKVVKVKTKKE